MVNRTARGMSALPHLPHLDPLTIVPLLGIFAVMALSMVMILPMLSARSPVRLVRPEEIEVGLDDVVGLDSQVDEVKRTLDVFLAYKTFREHMGGNPRRGVLFEGPPGTGKTYLAKAMAKQAGVPFLFASASQFQNVYFGMTQVRLRRFFKKLRKAAAERGGSDRLHRGDRLHRREPRRRRGHDAGRRAPVGAEPVRRPERHGHGPGHRQRAAGADAVVRHAQPPAALVGSVRHVGERLPARASGG